jgi:ABC-type sugar transport system substrate-binding protein
MPSILRKQGLERAVKGREDVRLNQIVFANWSKKLSSIKMKALYKRYPQTSIFWTASDLMAIGVAEGLESMDLKPGIDGLTGV